jgi:hypothetical protein
VADLERFVSTGGKDAAGRGTAAAPFRTISKATADLRASLAPGQTGKILVEPGLYEEVVVLTDNMQLMRKDGADQVTCDVAAESISENQTPVRIKRPPASSAPKESSSSPTWPEVLKIHGSDVVVTGVRLEGDHRPQRVVFVHESRRVRISGCAIDGGQSRIIYSGKGAGTRADPFHSKVAEEGEGAGLRILGSTDVTLHNCSFSDNRTELKFEQAVKDVDIDILKNSTTWKLAVALGQIDPVKVEQKLRQPQPVRTGGGHLSCFDSHEIHVDNCFFDGGFCGGRGGAVQLAHNSSASFDKCLFRNNESGVDGGALAFSDPDPDFFTRRPVTITGCKFLGNTAGDDGGGAYFTTNGQATMRDCAFKKNKANGNGGAVRITFGARLTAENCTFVENAANVDSASRLEKNQDGGGAIAVQDGSLDVRGGTMFSNRVGGFAGGAIYFITAAYDENAERLAKITHGKTFEDILKQGYKVTSVELKVTNVSIANNVAEGETCYNDVCTLSPRAGFKAGGAGGAIYALESLKDFKLPATVTIDGVRVVENKSSHNDDNQKAELVFRNVTRLVVKGDHVAMHPGNKFAFSLIDVHDADMTGSPDYAKLKGQGLVHESGSHVKP